MNGPGTVVKSSKTGLEFSKNRPIIPIPHVPNYDTSSKFRHLHLIFYSIIILIG